MEIEVQTNPLYREAQQNSASYDPHVPMIVDAWESPVSEFQKLLSKLFMGEK